MTDGMVSDAYREWRRHDRALKPLGRALVIGRAWRIHRALLAWSAAARHVVLDDRQQWLEQRGALIDALAEVHERAISAETTLADAHEAIAGVAECVQSPRAARLMLVHRILDLDGLRHALRRWHAVLLSKALRIDVLL